MRADRFELPLRIVVEDTVPGLVMGVQRDTPAGAAVVDLATGSGKALAFPLEVVVDGALKDGRPRFLGPYVQGPPAERFVYLCVGLYAGQADSPWNGRVKVPLKDISWTGIEALPSGHRLEGRIPGRGRKDGPALASVPILAPGWKAVPA